MKYQVMRIEEDLDFGCEERGADEPVMAVVVLKDENGTESRIRQEDQMLYDWNIEEGDTVILNGNDLALGCKMLYSLREIEFQFCIYICFQKISERTQFISFRRIFNIACDKDDDCVIPLLPNPPGQIDTGSSTIAKINIQKSKIIGL